jgi:hypothetical protein
LEGQGQPSGSSLLTGAFLVLLGEYSLLIPQAGKGRANTPFSLVFSLNHLDGDCRTHYLERSGHQHQHHGHQKKQTLGIFTSDGEKRIMHQSSQ